MMRLSYALLTLGLCALPSACSSRPELAHQLDATPQLTDPVHVAAHAPGKCSLCELYAGAQGWILRVRGEGETDTLTGTGFVIAPGGRAITNAHLVQADRKVQVEFPSGRVFAAEVLRIDKRRNLALLQVLEPGLRWTTAPILAEHAPLGSEVYALGYLGEHGWSLTRGEIMPPVEINGLNMLRVHSPESLEEPSLDSWSPDNWSEADKAYGNWSPDLWGAPLLDADGNVVGIILSRIAEPAAEMLPFVLPTEAFMEFLALEQE